MSVNSANSLNNVDIVKLALQKKGIQTKTTVQPEWMTPSGSVWNAPQANAQNNVIGTGTKPEIREQNQYAVLNQAQSGKGEEEKPDYSNMSAAEGRAMADDAKNQQKSAKAGTKETEQNTQVVNKYSSEAQKTSKDLVKNQKDLDKKIKSESKTVTQNQVQIAKLTDGIGSTQDEITSLQAELATLTAGDNTGVGKSSAFSLSLAGDQQNERNGGVESGSGNEQRIQELQALIGTKTTSMNTSGARIGKLQTSTDKSIKTMHKVSLSQMNYYKKAQKSLDSNEKASDKVLKVANKIDDISGTVAMAGMAVKTAGQGLMLLGQATSWCFGAGAALIAAGTVMQKVGTVTEMVGNYGQLAAGVTKTACYAAQGNLVGALTSAGSAIMSGTQAIKATQNLQTTFKEIGAKANEATQKLAAGVLGKEAVKDMSKEQLGNMTKGQAKALAKEGAMTELQGQSAKAIKESFKKGGDTALKDVAGIAANNTVNGAINETLNMTKAQIKEGIKKGTISVVNSTNQAVTEAAAEALAETGKDAVKKGGKKAIKNLLTFDNAMKVGNALQTAGAKLKGMQQGTEKGKGKSKGSTFSMTDPTRGYAMAAKFDARRANLYNRMSA